MAAAGPGGACASLRGYRRLPGAPRPEGQGGPLWGRLGKRLAEGTAASVERRAGRRGPCPAAPSGHLSAPQAACAARPSCRSTPPPVPLPLAGLCELVPQAELLYVMFFVVSSGFPPGSSALLSPGRLVSEGCSAGQPRGTARSGGFHTALSKNSIVTGIRGPAGVSRESPLAQAAACCLCPVPSRPGSRPRLSRAEPHQQRPGQAGGQRGMPGRQGPSCRCPRVLVTALTSWLSPAAAGFALPHRLVRLPGGGGASSCTRL